jgi:hypothetical protein
MLQVLDSAVILPCAYLEMSKIRTDASRDLQITRDTAVEPCELTRNIETSDRSPTKMANCRWHSFTIYTLIWKYRRIVSKTEKIANTRESRSAPVH